MKHHLMIKDLLHFKLLYTRDLGQEVLTTQLISLCNHCNDLYYAPTLRTNNLTFIISETCNALIFLRNLKM